MAYIVVQCPHCGFYGTGWTKKLDKYRFQCTYCGRSRKIKAVGVWGLNIKIYGIYSNPREAQLICAELKKQSGEKFEARKKIERI